MSVERLVRADGAVVWRVRWRQGDRSKVLGRKRAAEAFDAEIWRRKRTGEIALLDAGKQPLWEFGGEWWRLHARPNLAPATLELYAMLWDTHILPRLGSLPLADLTPERLNAFRIELEADGVGRVSVRKALTLLHGVLRRACEWGGSPRIQLPACQSRRERAPAPRARSPGASGLVPRLHGEM